MNHYNLPRVVVGDEVYILASKNDTLCPRLKGRVVSYMMHESGRYSLTVRTNDYGLVHADNGYRVIVPVSEYEGDGCFPNTQIEQEEVVQSPTSKSLWTRFLEGLSGKS